MFEVPSYAWPWHWERENWIKQSIMAFTIVSEFVLGSCISSTASSWIVNVLLSTRRMQMTNCSWLLTSFASSTIREKHLAFMISVKAFFMHAILNDQPAHLKLKEKNTSSIQSTFLSQENLSFKSCSEFPSNSWCPLIAKPCLRRNLSDEICLRTISRCDCWSLAKLSGSKWKHCPVDSLALFLIQLACVDVISYVDGVFHKLFFSIVKAIGYKSFLSFLWHF